MKAKVILPIAFLAPILAYGLMVDRSWLFMGLIGLMVYMHMFGHGSHGHGHSGSEEPEEDKQEGGGHEHKHAADSAGRTTPWSG